MSALDRQLEQGLASGRLTLEDVETVQEFATFLGKLGPAHDDGDRSPETIRKRRRALIEHAELCGLTLADVERLRAAEAADG